METFIIFSPAGEPILRMLADGAETTETGCYLYEHDTTKPTGKRVIQYFPPGWCAVEESKIIKG